MNKKVRKIIEHSENFKKHACSPNKEVRDAYFDGMNDGVDAMLQLQETFQ